MKGVLGIKPYVARTQKLEEFLVRWKTNNTILQETGEPSIYGLWAYDATVALAVAIERVGTKNITNLKRNETLGFSDEFGQNLSQELSNIHFEGLSGNFRIFKGQLVTADYEIINIVGNEMRKIGFWTPKYGIVKEVSTTTNDNNNYYSTSRDNLRAVIWPGGGTFIPKGWEIPTNRKKLRIGVPNSNACGEFVTLKIDPITNSSVASGFCIDVFDSVMAALPYHVPYEYIPFVDSEGKMLDDYNNLVYQVFLEKYDAVMGNVKILSNITSYVDFTLPYTESGVVLVVPYVDKNKIKAAWIFMKPLTWKLWLNNQDGEGSEASQDDEGSEANQRSRWHHTRATFYSTFTNIVDNKYNFTNSNIKTYESIPELHAMFEDGSISAVFDEIPYMRVFLANYCGKYTMVQPPLKTNGFIFVFPIGSPLLHDVSKAVLNATEEQNMKRIERAWLEQERYCSDSLDSTTSAIESFWGLFVVIGVGSVLALIAFLGAFLYDNRTTIVRAIVCRNNNQVAPGNGLQSDDQIRAHTSINDDRARVLYY
ncbi:hypothetical protein Leryth_025409 [Lithospermum erythrorhizon]|nr:hypothetical protein Leryth_025409 [Lithospermum erythrorhizon]